MRDELGDMIYESNKLVLLLFGPGVPYSNLRVHQTLRKSPVEMKEGFSASGKVERERE